MSKRKRQTTDQTKPVKTLDSYFGVVRKQSTVLKPTNNTTSKENAAKSIREGAENRPNLQSNVELKKQIEKPSTRKRPQVISLALRKTPQKTNSKKKKPNKTPTLTITIAKEKIVMTDKHVKIPIQIRSQYKNIVLTKPNELNKIRSVKDFPTKDKDIHNSNSSCEFVPFPQMKDNYVRRIIPSDEDDKMKIDTDTTEEIDKKTCPVCEVSYANENEFQDHLDSCLADLNL
eukprot:TRINITY_DN8451_c0_g1_i1.p1 TRINITY_DN8451_c0_g1~~TRINITY_DN8451_c0_g1_i1.p1  ORF type:complete len:231 (-),score=22.16 TRINITY_DN8451_c0_g1_i1:63-755(-)